MRSELDTLVADLLALADGEQPCAAEDARGRANSLALRATQAALVAAKGAGFVATHPTGRWCREALFFLVWSCPQNVLAANLCEFAGLA
jgi:alkylation response protein AidB-like acyl-CoA dehydrogenase